MRRTYHHSCHYGAVRWAPVGLAGREPATFNSRSSVFQADVDPSPSALTGR